MNLHGSGVLQKYGVEMIGANAEAIEKGEDRQVFKDLMLSIGRSLFREGLWEHAARFFRRAVTADERSADAAADLAYTLHRQGDGVQARIWLERALDLDPSNHDARSLLANLFYDGGEPEKALQHLERIPLHCFATSISRRRGSMCRSTMSGINSINVICRTPRERTRRCTLHAARLWSTPPVFRSTRLWNGCFQSSSGHRISALTRTVRTP